MHHFKLSLWFYTRQLSLRLGMLVSLLFLSSLALATDEIIQPDGNISAQNLNIRLTPKEKLWLAQNQTIRVAVKKGWMPIEFMLENNQHRGLSIDYLSKISSLLNIKFSVINYSEDLDSTQVDMISAMGSILGEKNSFRPLNQPYLMFPHAIYTKKSKNKKFHSLEDLKSSRIAIFKNGPLGHKILENYPKIKLVYVDIADEAFDKLKSGAIDAYIGNEMVLDYHISVHHLVFVEKAGLTPFSSSVFMAVQNDKPELASALEKSILAIGQNNNELLDNWRVTEDHYNQILSVILAGVFLIFLFVSTRFYRFHKNSKKQNSESQQKIWYQANYDHLTKLPNRHLLQNRLEQAMERADRSKLPLAVLFIDLDNFKQVNDTSGHSVGDKLLADAANRICRCVRSEDTTARFGGDEFMIVMSDINDMRSLEKVCKKILIELKKPFDIDSDKFFISASIGVSIYPNNGLNPEELISYADQAMYESKKLGRNQYQFFTASIQTDSLKKLSLSNDLRDALIKNEFVIFYQPIVNLENSNILKAEALIRWNHPTNGMVNPMDFIPLAEESGLIHELGDWVFHQALKDLPVIQAQFGAEFQVSINVSPYQFQKPDNLLKWAEAIKKVNISGNCFSLEITEGILLEPSSAVINTIAALRSVNIAFSIDDFGTGYSALAYLKKFNIDYVKIDKSFVQNLQPNNYDAVLCEAIINMARKLGIKVIAEGIETNIQQELLKRFSCDYGQGYLFAKPQPLDMFLAFLASNKNH